MERSQQGREESEPRLRADERATVRTELEGRLRDRGVMLTGEESDDEIAQLADVVERFEDAVIAAGGDRMIDSADSSEPDNPELVLPARTDDERVDAYIRRVSAAASRIRA
jgi:hypothetical protein